MTSLAWPVCYETMSFIIQSPNPSLVSMQSLPPFPHVAVMNFLAPPKKQEEERGKNTATVFKDLSPLPPNKHKKRLSKGGERENKNKSSYVFRPPATFFEPPPRLLVFPVPRRSALP